MKKISEEIKKINQKYHHEYVRILNAIKRYNKIAVFRHIMPDFDALGTQLGLATWLKDNFKDKDIKVLGDNHVTFTPRIYPEMDRLNDSWFNEPFLAIIVDVGNDSRIADPRYKKAKFIIKLDHHPKTEDIADVDVTETTMAAASELVVNMLLSFKGDYFISEKSSSYFYSALVGDSGRFMYSSTSKHTFEIAQALLNCNINISKIYQTMYEKKIDDLYVTSYVLNNFKVSKHGVAYYLLPLDIQNKLKITTEQGKENVNLFSNIKGINAWCSITEDSKEPCWRISIRSKEKPINQVAAMFEGGGHAQASGAKINSLSDLDRFINELDKLFIE